MDVHQGSQHSIETSLSSCARGAPEPYPVAASMSGMKLCFST